MQHTILVATLVLTVSATALAEEFTVIAWNVESGGAEPETLIDQVFDTFEADIWLLSEVESIDWAFQFKNALERHDERDYWFEIGTTGGADRLAVILNWERFDLISTFELHDINIGGRVRAPLVAHLRDRLDSREFLVVVNHLYRSNASARHRQARMLNNWAEAQRLPVITGGDFNFDWAVDGGELAHDTGYDELTAGGVFQWVRPPDPLRKTQCSLEYNSVLDFVFATGVGAQWTAVGDIIDVSPTYCDDENGTLARVQSDHLPVRAVFAPLDSVVPVSDHRVEVLDAVLATITDLEAELAELRALVEALR